MQQTHEARFVIGTRAGHDFDSGCTFCGLDVIHGGKIRTADYSVLIVLVGPQTHLTADLTRCATGVAGDDLHFHAGIAAILYGGRHIGAHRVTDGHNTHKGERSCATRLEVRQHLVRIIARRQPAISKRQCTHCFGLVIGKLVGNLLEWHVAHHRVAQAHDDFGSALDQQPAVSCRVIDDRGHHLGHGREGHQGQYLTSVARRHIVKADITQPQQQRALGGVSQRHHVGRIAVVEKSGTVAGDALAHQRCGIVSLVKLFAVFQTIEMRLIDLHLVLGERARLVGTDYRRGAHRLAGVHATHQIVVFQHLAHAQCERQRDAHGQALRHRDNNQRDSKHHRLDQVLCIGNNALAACDKILQQAAQHQQTRHHIAATGNQAAQAVELLCQRGLDVVVDLRIAVNLAIFGHVAHTLDAYRGITLDNGARAQQQIDGIGRFGRSGTGVMGLPCRGLPGKGALIHPEVETIEHDAVGRHFLACLEQHDVPHNDITPRHLRNMAAAHHFHVNMVIGLVEQTEFLVGADLDQKAHQRGQHDGHKDAYRLKQGTHTHVQTEIFIGRQAQGQCEGHQQDLDKRIVKFCEKLSPQGVTTWRGKHVVAVLSTAGNNLFGGQPSIVFLLYHDYNESISQLKTT